MWCRLATIQTYRPFPTEKKLVMLTDLDVWCFVKSCCNCMQIVDSLLLYQRMIIVQTLYVSPLLKNSNHNILEQTLVGRSHAAPQSKYLNLLHYMHQHSTERGFMAIIRTLFWEMTLLIQILSII